MALVKRFGEMWARNPENIKSIPGPTKGRQGVYVLYEGLIPLYFGRGNISSAIKRSSRHNLRGHRWDHFSWYALSDPALSHDVESLLLRITRPFYLRTLNRQNGKFEGARRGMGQQDRDHQSLISRAKSKRKRWHLEFRGRRVRKGQLKNQGKDRCPRGSGSTPVLPGDLPVYRGKRDGLPHTAPTRLARRSGDIAGL